MSARDGDTVVKRGFEKERKPTEKNKSQKKQTEQLTWSEVPEDDEGSEREDLTDGMRRDGWVWYRGYGTEGDCVRVVRRELR